MNHALHKLFKTKNPYDPVKNDPLFFQAIKQTMLDVKQENKKYEQLLKNSGFEPESMTESMESLAEIPVLPTLFLKRNDLSGQKKSLVEVTSSGTSGKVSRISYSLEELYLLAKMSIRLGRLHHLFSIRPTRYIMLGYQPTRKNRAVISKTAFLSTLYTPVIRRSYALTWHHGKYELDLDTLIQKILSYARKKSPVRIVGFPSYTFFLLQQMKKNGQCCQLPKGSKILFGGGWKQFEGEAVSKEELFALVKEVLGVEASQIHEFFGTAEHPVLYCTCKNHQFHVPAYGKVIIRDIKTGKPLPEQCVGMVNLLTPVKSTLPIMSVMTDDLGVWMEGKTCGCGIETPVLKILGRVGAKGVTTCSAGAKEYLANGVEKRGDSV